MTTTVLFLMPLLLVANSPISSTIDPGIEHSYELQLAAGRHRVLVNEAGADLSITVSFDDQSHTADSPLGAVATELLAFSLTDSTVVTVTVSRLDELAAPTRYELDVSSPTPTDELLHNAISTNVKANSNELRDKAAQQFVAAARSALAIGDTRYGAAALLQAGRLYGSRLLDKQTAIALSEEAVSLTSDQPTSLLHLSALLAFAQAYRADGQHSQAIRILDLIGQINAAEDAPRRAVAAIGANDRCLLDRLAANLLRADQCYRHVIDEMSQLGLRREAANSTHNLAILQAARGHLEDAQSSLQAVISYNREEGRERGLARALAVSVKISADAGELQSARDHYTEARALLEQNEMFDWLARLDTNYARLLLLHGENETAAALLEKAIAMARDQGDVSAATYATVVLADSAFGADTGALSRLKEAAQGLKDSQLTSLAFWVRLQAIRAAISADDIPYARRELANLGRFDDRADVAASHNEIYLEQRARLAAHAGNINEALTDLAEATSSARNRRDPVAELRLITTELRLRTAATPDVAGPAPIDRGSDLSHQIVASLVLPEHQARVAASLHDFSDATVRWERGRTGTVSYRTLSRIDANRSLVHKAHQRTQVRQTEASARALEELRVAMWHQLLRGQGDVSTALEAFEKTRTDQWRSAQQGQSDPVAGDPPSLREDTIVRYFLWSDDELWAFTLRHDGSIETSPPIASADILADIDAAMEAVSSPQGEGFRSSSLLALSRTVLGPAYDDATIRAVHFAFDGALTRISPAMLLRENGGLVPAVDQLKTDLITDLNDLTLNHQPSAELSSIAIIGDPVTSHRDPRLTAEAPATGVFERLPYAAAEVEYVKQATQGATQIVRTGHDATPAALTALPDVDVIHIAAHATVDRSGIPLMALSTFDRQSEPTVGALLPWDIVNAQLTPTLVFLSACRTQAGEAAFGAELNSLAAAFSYAGADTVIASRWPIDDEASSLLVDFFYSHLADGLSAEDALRRAQAEMSYSPRFAHPYFWATFAVTGRPGIVWSKPSIE